MPEVKKPRVLESSTSVGTGSFVTAGAITGFQAFSAAMGVGDTCWYYIEAVDDRGVPTGQWEIGFGTYSAANTLSRGPTDSSAGGGLVDFAAGLKLVGLASNPAGGTTNLTYTASPTGGLVASDTGTDATLPLADATNAGLQSPASFSKLAGIQAGAQVNTVTSVAGRTGAITLTAADVSGLAAVATSGVYADLTGKPTIRPGADPLTAQVFG